MYACLAVTCHLHFWQNDRDFLRATAVTRGWNGYRNNSQHRKSTLEKKILPPFQQGFEPATFQSRVRRSNHWAIPAPGDTTDSVWTFIHIWWLPGRVGVPSYRSTRKPCSPAVRLKPPSLCFTDLTPNFWSGLEEVTLCFSLKTVHVKNTKKQLRIHPSCNDM